MRVTTQMMSSNLLRNLQRNASALARSNDMLSTGKRINAPSDDPVGIGRVEALHSDLIANEQYSSNVSEATGWLTSTDEALNQMTNTLQKARELAVYGATDTLSAESRAALGKEVDQLLQQALQVANSQHAGRYIFSGFKTTTLAYPTNTYNGGAADVMNYEIGQGITLPVNITGPQAFGPDGGNVFQVLQDLRDNLNANNAAGVRTAIGQVDARLDDVVRWRSEVGARMNRLEATEDQLSAQKVNLTRLLSNVEDADMAQVIVDLKTQETIYRSALDSGARIIQPTLMDFLS